ncbi:MAG TPA: cytochrome c3 family protein [Anaeromyxobacteraceae bacterium]|nr:cytochrome c3 family protein [Anaeromyxobacteraceae bacterium]
MKALLSMAAAAILFVATAAVAAAPAKPVVLPAKSGAVTFNHAKHPGVKCEQCHADAKGGKIAGLDKEKGHAMCHECHKKEGKGPQKCAECHKK